MKKLEGFPKTHKEPTIQWLDKNWVDIYIKNIEDQTKEQNGCFTPTRLNLEGGEKFTRSNVNMSPNESLSELSGKKQNKSRRIKFESKSSFVSGLSIEHFDRNSLPKSSLTRSISHDYSTTELLDPTNCFHPDCCFAYNIGGDVKKASFIAECLPTATYQRLAALWDLDPNKTPRVSGNTCKLQNEEEENQILDEFIRSVERDLGIRSDLSEDLQVEVGSFTEISDDKKPPLKVKSNPYLKFLKKSRALECQRRGTSRLGKKVGKITKIIIKNFLEWYQSLGEHDEESIIEDTTLEELFQIGFDMPAAKSLAMRIKELPTVPECLAILRNEPKHATRYGLREYLKQDIKMENIPTKMFAFGRMLPKEKPSLRYKPPRNFVRKTWMECSRVPGDLDSMKTIWEGLEKLRSTIAFSTWLNNHPEITPPAYLKQQGLLKINYEEWNQMYKGFELEVDNVESGPSEIDEKSSMQEVQYAESTRLNFGSIDSF